MNGLHFSAELYGCQSALHLLLDADALRTTAHRLITAAGLTPVGEVFHTFAAPGGVTGVVLLAESHWAVHTWPELGSVTLDLYVCNRSADHGAQAARVMAQWRELLRPERVQERVVERGSLNANQRIGNEFPLDIVEMQTPPHA